MDNKIKALLATAELTGAQLSWLTGAQLSGLTGERAAEEANL